MGGVSGSYYCVTRIQFQELNMVQSTMSFHKMQRTHLHLLNDNRTMYIVILSNITCK